MRIDFEQGLPRIAGRWGHTGGRARMRGMSLIELLTVVAVLAILSSIAVSSYRRYLVRTNRTEATGALLRVQVAQEKFFLQNNTYTNNMTSLGVPATTPTGNYSIAVGATGLATSFTATATPQGRQASSDADCQTLTIDDKGQRGSTPGAASLCWK